TGGSGGSTVRYRWRRTPNTPGPGRSPARGTQLVAEQPFPRRRRGEEPDLDLGTEKRRETKNCGAYCPHQDQQLPLRLVGGLKDARDSSGPAKRVLDRPAEIAFD